MRIVWADHSLRVIRTLASICLLNRTLDVLNKLKDRTETGTFAQYNLTADFRQLLRA